MRDNNDIQLVKDCLKGADSAFKALYESYSGYVYTICSRYGISNLEIKDCMQIIFMELFQSLSKYDSERSKFKTWLTRLTINQILAHKRKQKVQYTTIESDELNLIESDFAINIESDIDIKVIYSILGRMPAKFSAIFNLFIIDGYSHNEISSMLNITEGASRILLHRGRVWAMKELKSTFAESINSLKKTRVQNK